MVLDALASLAGPVLVKTGIDSGVAKGSVAVLFAASAVYLAVTLADLVDEIGETFVTGRTAQRIMLSLRIRIWAQLQRLSLDYYEREMAGRIMTRMTTDVDQFESLIENGLLSALVSIVTFVGVGVALVVHQPRARAVHADRRRARWPIATVVFRRRAARLYDLSRERIGIVNADFQESLSGVREAQAFVHEEADQAALPPARARLPRVPGGGPTPGRHLLPLRPVPVRGGRRHRARRGRRAHRHRAPGLGRADRLHPLHRPVLLPHPAALPGLRLLAADTGLGAAASPSSCSSRRARPPAPDAARGGPAGRRDRARRRPLRLPRGDRPARPRRRRPTAGGPVARAGRADAGPQAARGPAGHRPADRGRARRWPWWARRGRASRR